MIRLTREVRGSIDPARLDSAFSNSWGGWPSAHGPAPYLTIRITVSGTPHPATGYLCDIKTLDELARQFVLRPAAVRGSSFTVGELPALAWQSLAPRLPEGVTLETLLIAINPYLRWQTCREKPTMVQVTQQFEFSAAHRLHCDTLSPEENKRVFGKCNNPSGHGHNYLVDVTIEGEPDPRTGLLLATDELERRVAERVIRRLDHKHLNLDTPEFAALNPSVENIAMVVWRLLDGQLAPARLASVRIYETPKTWAEFSGA